MLRLYCLQSTEVSGQISSVAEGINEGEEGEGDSASADAESFAPASRRATEDSVISSMLGTSVHTPELLARPFLASNESPGQ